MRKCLKEFLKKNTKKFIEEFLGGIHKEISKRIPRKVFEKKSRESSGKPRFEECRMYVALQKRYSSTE